MLREHKLQMQFHAFDASTEGRVLSYLRDRQRLTANSAREKVLQALAAWLAVDELESNRSQLDDGEFQQQLGTAIAVLDARSAYCRSLLAFAGGGQERPSLEAQPIIQSQSVAAPVEPPVVDASSTSERDSSIDIDDAAGEVNSVEEQTFASSSVMSALFQDIEVEE